MKITDIKDFSIERLKSYTNISCFKHIEDYVNDDNHISEIVINDTLIDDLTDFQHIAHKVSKLYINQGCLTSLKGLEHFTNLSVLSINKNKTCISIENVQLEHLTEIHIINSNLKDNKLPVISSDRVNYLVIYQCGINDISNISQYTNLYSLNLNYNDIVNIDELANVKFSDSVYNITLTYNKIENIDKFIASLNNRELSGIIQFESNLINRLDLNSLKYFCSLTASEIDDILNNNPIIKDIKNCKEHLENMYRRECKLNDFLSCEEQPTNR